MSIMRRLLVPLLGLLGALTLANTVSLAQDKIIANDGKVQEGEIVGFSNNQVMIKLPAGTIGVPLVQVKRVEMAAPPAIKQALATAPAASLSVLEAAVTKFKGLPADWVVEAMGHLADGYASQNNAGKAEALYQEMSRLYAGSRFIIKATVGMAKTALQQNQPDQALQLLRPLIAQANARFYQSMDDSRLLGEAFLVQGQVLEAQGKLGEALASYLQTTTLFFHNEPVTKEAATRAAQLRERNPKLVTP
jgi:tetratricopeptide (TPR) repeat protein